MKFFIEQIALCVPDPIAAKVFLDKMREVDGQAWQDDHVLASGRVDGMRATNEADLSFCYNMLDHAKELEILRYTEGQNWMEGLPPSVSHFGMHCTSKELLDWRAFFAKGGIPVVQEVHTVSHTNPNIRYSRRYNYVIFGTREILGVDLKFIVRLPGPEPV